MKLLQPVRHDDIISPGTYSNKEGSIILQIDLYGHRTHPRELKDLTNAALSRLLLRKIWYIQDELGVSMGRSHRNQVLEAAMHLLPLQPIARYLDLDIPFEEIISVAAVRRTDHHRRRPSASRPRPPLAELGDLELAALLLRILKSAYRRERKRDIRDRQREERELLETALELFPEQKAIPKPLPWKTEDIIKEADRRRYRSLKKK